MVIACGPAAAPAGVGEAAAVVPAVEAPGEVAEVQEAPALIAQTTDASARATDQAVEAAVTGEASANGANLSALYGALRGRLKTKT